MVLSKRKRKAQGALIGIQQKNTLWPQPYKETSKGQEGNLAKLIWKGENQVLCLHKGPSCWLSVNIKEVKPKRSIYH